MKAAKIGLALLLAPATVGVLTLTGCGSTPTTPVERANLADDSQTKLKTLTRQFPELQTLIDNSYGYAIFPSVGKGGLGVSVASGQGVAYEQGKYIGTSHLSIVNVGLTVVGEDYAELLIFQTKAAMDNFEANQLKFDAQASAVALKEGAHADAKFNNGVGVFTKTNSGFGVDASIGGQQFTFTLDRSVMKPSATAPTTMPTGM